MSITTRSRRVRPLGPLHPLHDPLGAPDRRIEWALTAVVAVSIVVVNKVLIQDRGSAWATLSMMAFWTGRGVVVVRRWLIRGRADRRRTLRS